MSTPSFDLVDIVQTIRARRRFVIIVTIAAALVGGLFFFTRKKKYEVKSEFLVANPLYSDRNNLFRSQESRFVDYVGGDDDLDRITVIAESDTVKDQVIRKLNLAEAYQVDMNKPDAMFRLRNIFKKNLDVKRTEYKDMLLSYVDYDPNRAVQVANETIKTIEQVFRGYYNNMRQDVYDALVHKIHEQDSAIQVYTDTLSTLRSRYGIYDIISPSRQNIMVSTVKGNSGTTGAGIEQIQNIESVKDQLVTDRAKNYSLMNEFSTGTKPDQMPMIQLITSPKAPIEPKGPGLLITVVACALLGLFFSVMYVLMTTYYRALISVKR